MTACASRVAAERDGRSSPHGVHEGMGTSTACALLFVRLFIYILSQNFVDFVFDTLKAFILSFMSFIVAL